MSNLSYESLGCATHRLPVRICSPFSSDDPDTLPPLSCVHRFCSVLFNPGRSSVHTRYDESILTLFPTLRNEISPIDRKVLGELSQSEYIGSNERKSEYLILPPGF